MFRIASKGYLWPPTLQNLNNLLVRNVAHLVVLLDNFAVLVTDSP